MTKSFSGLLPNEIYNFYAMKSQASANPLSSDNLLYIAQAVSDENGELSINYLPKEDYEGAVCFVVPMKQADLSDAEVMMENPVYNGEEQFVNPTVTLNGKTLTEGVDYNLCGDYSATGPDEYTVIIRGIGYYTGEITFTYKVTVDCVIGDVNDDGEIDVIDATLVQRYSAEFEEFTYKQMAAADTNHDGTVDITDATMIPKFVAEVIDSF